MRILHELIGERTNTPAPPRALRAFVPTMGSLHEGHRSLIREARRHVGPEGEVFVSVFVNPTQFGHGEDFDAYPRDLDSDAQICSQEGVDVLYAPSARDIYGERGAADITIDPGPLGRQWEGEHRPEHFSGVLTVVGILLNKVQPDIAVFGEKDYQQLVLVRQMCRELSFGVEIVGAATVRDHDGLALSSRNVFLDGEQRQRATAIPLALEAAQLAAAGGANAAVRAAQALLSNAGLTPDYLAVCDPELRAAPAEGQARLLLAVPVGPTRLIDNCAMHLGGDNDQ